MKKNQKAKAGKPRQAGTKVLKIYSPADKAAARAEFDTSGGLLHEALRKGTAAQIRKAYIRFRDALAIYNGMR